VAAHRLDDEHAPPRARRRLLDLVDRGADLVAAQRTVQRGKASRDTHSAVSAPIERAEPGTLLLMVAGRTQMGRRSAGWAARARSSSSAEWKA